MNDEHRDDDHDGAAPEPSDEPAAEQPSEPNLDEVEPELLATFTEIGIVETRRAIEAILLVATDPTPASLLAQLLEVPVEHVELLCHALADSYEEANHGFQLVKVAGGWRFQTHPDMAPYVERFAMDGQSTKLSNAALETLAIVAYKQPISRAQVSAIRGVNVDAVLRTLVQRGYVDEVGRDTGAGQAVLFGTTSMFLERLGINAVTDLPALGDFVPSAEVVEALEQTLKVDLDPDFGVIDPDEDAPPSRPTPTDSPDAGEGPVGEGDEHADQPEDATFEPDADVADGGVAEASVSEAEVEVDAAVQADAGVGDDVDGSVADAEVADAEVDAADAEVDEGPVDDDTAGSTVDADGEVTDAELADAEVADAEVDATAAGVDDDAPAEVEVDAEAEVEAGDDADGSAIEADSPPDISQSPEPVESVTEEAVPSPAAEDLDRTEPEAAPAADPGDQPESAEHDEAPVEAAAETEPELVEAEVVEVGQPTDFPREIESSVAEVGCQDEVVSAASDGAEVVEVGQSTDFPREIESSGAEVGCQDEVALTGSDDAGQSMDFPQEIGPSAAGAAEAIGSVEVDQPMGLQREMSPSEVESAEAARAVVAEPVGRESAADGAGEKPVTASPQPPAAPEGVVGDAEASPKSGAAGHAGGLAPIDDRQQPTGPADGGEPQLAGATADPMAGARTGIDADARPDPVPGGHTDREGTGGHNTDSHGPADTPDPDARFDAASRSGGAPGSSDGRPQGSDGGRSQLGAEPGPDAIDSGGRTDSGQTGSGQPGSGETNRDQFAGGQTGAGQAGPSGGWRPPSLAAGGAGQPVAGRPDPGPDGVRPLDTAGVAPAGAPTGAAPTPAGPAAQPDAPDPGHDGPLDRHGLPAAGSDPASSPDTDANRQPDGAAAEPVEPAGHQPGGLLPGPIVPGDGPGNPGLVGAVDPAVAPPASPVIRPEPVVHLDPVIDLTAEAVSEPDAGRA